MAKRQNFAWLTLLRLLANQLIILAKQTAHTQTHTPTQTETTNFRCVYVCIMHLSAPSICGASTSSCCSIDNPVGARGNGKGGMAEHRNQDGHTQTTHTSHTRTHTGVALTYHLSCCACWLGNSFFLPATFSDFLLFLQHFIIISHTQHFGAVSMCVRVCLRFGFVAFGIYVCVYIFIQFQLEKQRNGTKDAITQFSNK